MTPLDHLRMLHGEPLDGFLAICTKHRAAESKLIKSGVDPDEASRRSWQEEWFHATEIEFAAAYASKWSRKGRDVYTPQTLFKSESRAKGNALPSLCLSHELDKIHNDENAQLDLGPLVIASGTEGHTHPTYRLQDHVDEDAADALSYTLAVFGGMNEDGAKDGGKSESNGLTRLAGTYNYKTGKAVKVTVIHQPSKVWAYDDLVEAVGGLVTRPERAMRDYARHDDLVAERVAERRISDAAKGMLANDADTKGSGRWGRINAVIRQFMEDGLSPGQMLRVLEGHTNAILDDDWKPIRWEPIYAKCAEQNTTVGSRILEAVAYWEKQGVESRKQRVTSPGKGEGRHDTGSAVEEVDDDGPAGATWEPVNFDDVLDGTFKREKAVIGERDDAAGMFYPGKVNSLKGETESAKTWLALMVVVQLARAGKTSMFIDFEDDKGGVVGRLLHMGLEKELIRKHFLYVRPDEKYGPEARRVIEAHIRKRNVCYVPIDGVTEILGMHGLSANEGTDIATFIRLLPRAIANLGPAVVLLDHVVKNGEEMDRYDIGSGHKMAAINGVSYKVVNTAAGGEGETTRSNVWVAKDRPGSVRKNATVRQGKTLKFFGELVVNSESGTALVSVNVDTGTDADTEPADEDDVHKIRKNITRTLGMMNSGGVVPSQTRLLHPIKGHRPHILKELKWLIDNDYISIEPGARKSQNHTLEKPYVGVTDTTDSNRYQSALGPV
ncbi:AAA family ATPase [Rhodococcus sp. WB9]|uniref:AAA family ATPase n=1 Tax=Rhodococcus sp. WB9 TaxID=2594007 RepID=UPI00118488D7|nr:AAA family ATPase [Rhodococcus sp. WB9]QDQ91577.1 AAA family ATPase [Rhodococcus sp. WB9]